MREEAFLLTYCINGMTLGDVESMLVVDRKWYIKRLTQQIERERREIKDAK